ncbi:MAG TPA: hypothetical protein VMQ51_01345, partial [Candidatus Binatia bacterium]|nr:hypothetical protein [Candidatus Binatia bacterium]
MNYAAARVAGLLGLTILLALAGSADAAGVNAFWKELGGSASGGGISKLPLAGNVSANSAQVAFGSDSLPVVAYVTGPIGVTRVAAPIAVKRWTGTAWQDLSPAVMGFETRIAIGPTGTRYLSWLEDDGSGAQVHLLQRTASGTSWTTVGSANSSQITSLNSSGVFSHALAVGSDNKPAVAIDTLAQTGLPTGSHGVVQGTHQIYVLRFNGTAWEYLGGDPTTGGGASNAVSLFVDGTNYATHEASSPSLT